MIALRAAVWLMVWVVIARATLEPARASDMRALLTLRVNMVSKSEILIVLRGSDVLVRRADLQAAGLRGFSLDAGGEPSDLISLSSLGPDLQYHVDESALVLDVTVTPGHLATGTVVDFRATPPLTLTKPARSAFLNYSIGASNDAGATLATEVGVHLGAGILDSTRSFASRQTYQGSITNWIVDSPATGKRLTVGDVLAYSGDLGGSVMLAGAGVERYFALQPDKVRTVLPGLIGSVTTPSTADIYVNGQLYRRVELPPGQFNFQNLPSGEGPNTTRVVITDAFGRQQTLSNTFYQSDVLLAPGVTDFSYNVGLVRSEFGDTVTNGPAFLGRYASGLTRDATGGGRLEIGSGIASGGPSFAFRLHRGVVALAGALSRDGSAGGGAALASFQYVATRFNLGASVVLQSPRYATLAMPASSDRALIDANFSAGMPLSARDSVTLSFRRQQFRDMGSQNQLQLSQWKTLSPYATLQVQETLSTLNGARQFGISTSLNLMQRENMAASVTTTTSNGRASTTAELQRSIGAQTPSFGYDIAVNAAQGISSLYGQAQYRAPYGDYLANVSTGVGQTNLSLLAAGGLVAFGGKLYPTQSIADSYALVDTGGVAGLRVFENNIEVGGTDSHGHLIVPRLGSYYDNEISISSADLPLNDNIDSPSRHIMPGYRSGEVARFAISRVQPVTGTLVVRSGTSSFAPAFGILEVQGQDRVFTSDIGAGGEFYFDSLPSGEYTARARYKGGECSFVLKVPETSATFLKLGVVSCDNGAKQ